MGKKKRKNKRNKQLKKGSSGLIKRVNSGKENKFWSVGEIFNRHATFIGLLILLVMAVYANSLPGDWSIVDDLPGIINSGKYENFVDNFKSFHIQNIIYSGFINLFGNNPLPFHIFSVSLHVVNVVLAFILVYWLFGEKVAKISALVFAVHPVNTEAVTWISGSTYLINAIFILPSMMAYVRFKRSGEKIFLWWSLGYFIFLLALTRTPSVLTLPMALVVMDQLILEKKINWKSLLNLSWFAVPSVLYVVSFLTKATNLRLASRATGGYLNQQTLKPVVESWPYTISKMLELYFFPKKLLIYYDGNEITSFDYAWMMLLTFVFIIAVIYFWRKKREVAGLLMLLVVLLAPTMSPIKITWYMAERYMYFGSIFFGAIIGIGLIKLGRLGILGKYGRYVLIVFTLILVLGFSLRTVWRNMDYLDNKEFARITIKDAPLSVRPYNDLGSLYLMDGDRETAAVYYRQALEINHLSRTSINNIGLIYIQAGEIDLSQPNFSLSDSDKENPEQLYQKALVSVKGQKYTNAAYYVGEYLKFEPNGYKGFNLMGDVYVNFQRWEPAKKYYFLSLDLKLEQPGVYHKLSFISFKLGDLVKAKEYAEKTLEFNPDHDGAKKNMEILNERMKN